MVSKFFILKIIVLVLYFKGDSNKASLFLIKLLIKIIIKNYQRNINKKKNPRVKIQNAIYVTLVQFLQYNAN